MFKRNFSQVQNLKPILPIFQYSSHLFPSSSHPSQPGCFVGEFRGGIGGGLAATFDLAAFLVIIPLKKYVNHLRTIASIHKLQITQRSPNMFLCHFCSVLAFKSIPIIFFLFTLVVLSNSSATIRTKGMKGQLCVRLAISFRLMLIILGI